VKLARLGNHTDPIIRICSTCVKSSERFVQLGNGWVLRELSRADLNLVVNFIKENYKKFSREGLRYAIEKMDNKLRTKLMKYEVGQDSDSDDDSESDSNTDSNTSKNSSDSDDEVTVKKTSKKRKLAESEENEQPKKISRKKKYAKYVVQQKASNC